MPTINQHALLLSKTFEGLGDGDTKRPGLQFYWCPAKVATVGYGHALVDRASKLQVSVKNFGHSAASKARQAMFDEFGKETLTEEEAWALLKKDSEVREARLDLILAGVPTTEHEYGAMMSMLYNIGEANFKTTSVLRLHKARNKVESTADLETLIARSKLGKVSNITEAFAGWSKSDGQWSRGLFRRRLVEAKVYFGTDVTTAIATVDERIKRGI